MSQEDLTKLSLLERVSKYHLNENISDGRGGRLMVIDVSEFMPNVLGVQDTLGEIDIFFDTERWKVVDTTEHPYDIFLDSVRKSALQNRKEQYQMTCIAESAWNMFYCRRLASFEDARNAARAYLRAKKHQPLSN